MSRYIMYEVEGRLGKELKRMYVRPKKSRVQQIEKALYIKWKRKKQKGEPALLSWRFLREYRKELRKLATN